MEWTTVETQEQRTSESLYILSTLKLKYGMEKEGGSNQIDQQEARGSLFLDFFYSKRIYIAKNFNLMYDG